MTTKEEIGTWFDKGKESGFLYMIVVCDTFDHEDYPVYTKEEDFKKEYDAHNNINMQRVMEVYDLSIDKEFQINQGRAFNKPKGV